MVPEQVQYYLQLAHMQQVVQSLSLYLFSFFSSLLLFHLLLSFYEHWVIIFVSHLKHSISLIVIDHYEKYSWK